MAYERFMRWGGGILSTGGLGVPAAGDGPDGGGADQNRNQFRRVQIRVSHYYVSSRALRPFSDEDRVVRGPPPILIHVSLFHLSSILWPNEM